MKWIVLVAAAGAAFAPSASKCADLARFQMAGSKIEISTKMVAAGPGRGGRGPAGPMLPAHCRG